MMMMTMSVMMLISRYSLIAAMMHSTVRVAYVITLMLAA
jgi:hypothetical protein